MNQRMLINLSYKIIYKYLDIQSFKGVIHLFCHSSQLSLFLHQVYIMSLIGYRERTCHAGYSAADHQCLFIDRQVDFL